MHVSERTECRDHSVGRRQRARIELGGGLGGPRFGRQLPLRVVQQPVSRFPHALVAAAEQGVGLSPKLDRLAQRFSRVVGILAKLFKRALERCGGIVCGLAEFLDVPITARPRLRVCIGGQRQ